MVASEVLAIILSSLVSSGIVTAIAQLFFGYISESRIAELKASLELQNAQILARQNDLSEQLKTRFSALHTQRTEAMAEIYGLVVETEDAFDYFLRSWGRFRNEPGALDRFKAALALGQQYRDCYRRKRILFPKPLATKLDEMSRSFIAIANTYTLLLHMEDDDEYRALAKLLAGDVEQFKFKDPKPLLSELEDEFRRLQGVDETRTME